MSELSARRAATRERLVDAAKTVFAEKGVLGASVEEICEVAGFTRGAFYSNFGSKDDLCIAVLEHHYALQMEALDEAVASLHGLGPDATLDDLITSALEVFFASQPEGRHWTLASQELRLYAARSPELADAYRRFHSEASGAVATTLERAVASQGCVLVSSGIEAISVLHAVHDYGMIGSLIGSDSIEGDVKVRLLSQVLRALVRPAAVSV